MSDVLWEGGELPVGSIGTRSNGWWAMIFIILTEGALFAYLLFAYYYLAIQPHTADWPPGGPPVVAPGNTSYGTSTVRDLIPYEFGGIVDLAFEPDGVRCRLEIPGVWLSNSAEPPSEPAAANL